MFGGAFIKIPVDSHAKAKQSGKAISKGRILHRQEKTCVNITGTHLIFVHHINQSMRHGLSIQVYLTIIHVFDIIPSCHIMNIEVLIILRAIIYMVGCCGGESEGVSP